MSVEFLKNDIAEKCFRKIYLIGGNEAYLKNYYLTALKNSLLTADEEMFDLCRWEGNKLSAEEFSEGIQSLPMLAKKKLFIIKDLPLSSPVFSMLLSNPSLLAEGVCLVVYCDNEKYDKRTAEFKEIEKFIKTQGLTVYLDTPKPDVLLKWVMNYFSKRKIEISRQVAEYFIANVAFDMLHLKNEMDKLIFYKADSGKVFAEDIDLLSTKSADAKGYELTNAIFEKNYDLAYSIVKKLFQMNTFPMIILATIENSVATLIKTEMLLEEFKSEREISEILKMKEYPVKKNCEIVKRVGKKKLGEILDCCIEADITSKSTSVSLEDLIYKLIAECISKL